MQFTANLEPFSHPQRAKLGASSLSMHQPLLRINKHVSRSQQQPQDADLASTFSSFMLRNGELGESAPARPSPLLPPHSVVAAQMEALHRNDYPETDAGLQTAYRFAKPYGSEEFTLGQVPNSFVRVRSWGAAEQWLTQAEFFSMLSSVPYSPMIGCETWKAASGVVFPSVRHPHRAVQAVHVTAAPPLYPPPLPPWGGPAVPEGLRGSTVRGRGGPAGGPGGGDDANGWDQELKGVLDASGQGGVELVGGLPAGGAWSGAGQRQGGGSSSSSSSNGGEGGSQRPRVHTFTWCLERVETGALKGVWYTVGVRVGDYSF